MTEWLLTWLWQGSALAGLVAIALRCAPKRNAATRHFVWGIALGMLAWLGWTSSPFGPTMIAIVPSVEGPIYIPSAPDILINTFIGIWSAIALVGLLRVLPGLRAVYAARDRCRPFPADVEARLPLWLEAKEHGRRAELMICGVVPGPTVLGFQRSCIAIPASLIDALSISELDQVILHEYAHVQRRDDWSRLAQTLLLSVLWVHPAAVFVSRALSREREMACDEWVVARTGSPKAYAKCLAHAAEVRARLTRRPLLCATLLGTRHELVKRVDRVLEIRGNARRDISIAAAAAAACAMISITLQLQGVRGFSEVADIVLPHVSRPALSLRSAAGIVRPGRTGPDSSAAAKTLDAPAARIASIDVDALTNPAESTPGSMIPNASNDANGETNLPARVFAGSYSLPTAPAAASSDQSSPWRAMGAPGIEIATAAKKTSVGLAGVFSRAGVALARSF